jgi:hypothetical protein
VNNAGAEAPIVAQALMKTDTPECSKYTVCGFSESVCHRTRHRRIKIPDVNQQKKLPAGFKLVASRIPQLGALAKENPIHLAGEQLAMLIIGEPEIKGVTAAILLQEAKLRFFDIASDGEMQIEAVAGDEFLNGSLPVDSRIEAEILSNLMKDVLYADHNGGFRNVSGSSPVIKIAACLCSQ